MSESIRGITFDVGGTLIQPWPSVGHIYSEVAARHGMGEISPELLNERFKAAWRACRNFDYSRTGWERLVNETFHGPGRELERVAFFPELYNRFAEPEAWRVFDDVRPALEMLAPLGIRLGIISNWDERLPGLLQRLHLDQYFQTCVISCEVGRAKPSPVLFDRAAAGLDLPPSAILHVGDSFEMDVAGARAAGFQAVRIERGGIATVDGELDSLAGLRAKIETGISPG